MKVLLTSCDGSNFGRITTLPMDLPEDCTVDRLKTEAASRQGLLRSHLRLCVTYMGVKVLLAEGQTCAFYRITEGTAIHQETIGLPVASRNTETFAQSKYLRKLGITQNLPVIEERPARLLDQLIKACKTGRLEELTALCSEAELNQEVICEDGEEEEYIAGRSDKEGWTCFHYAAYQGQAKILAFLTSKRCNPNKESKDSWTPLQLACHQGHLDCVKELLKHSSIQINRLTSRGAALHMACLKGRDDIVQLLMEHEACLTQEDAQGRIPLEMTTKMTILEMIPKCMGLRQLAAIQLSKSQEIPKPEAPPPFCGEVYYSAPLTINDKKVYLVLDPGAGLLMRYSSQEQFLDNSKPGWSGYLTDIQTVVKINKGHFGKRKFGFIVEMKCSKGKYICSYEELIDEWVDRISDAVNYCQIHKIGIQTLRSSFAFRGSISEPIMPESQEERKTLSTTMGSVGSAVAEDEPASPANPEAGSFESVSFDSFEVIEELGSGSFGKVYKVKKVSDGKIYAMKSLSKQFLMKQKQLKYAIGECRILKSLIHPFVIRLHYAFQTPKSLYMVLEYCPNGDLSAHLTERGTFEEVEARQYIGETLLAIEYLHSQDIVYRDLKPENILLDRKGHVKLADFGLAKEGVIGSNTTKSFCGSPAYLAPEVVNQHGAGKPADIYGLGAILYEMLTGEPPFYSDNARELMMNIRSSTKLPFPAHVSEEAKDLIKSVLNKEPSKRPTIPLLKKHPFFKKVVWEKLQRLEIDPPVLGPGWNQDGDEKETADAEPIYPMRPIDKDYSQKPSMEECLVDYD